jgi:hypothetical protein
MQPFGLLLYWTGFSRRACKQSVFYWCSCVLVVGGLKVTEHINSIRSERHKRIGQTAIGHTSFYDAIQFNDKDGFIFYWIFWPGGGRFM